MDQELTSQGFNPSVPSILARHQLHFWVILSGGYAKMQLDLD